MAKNYSESSKIEIHKYLTDLAVRLIENGYLETNEQGVSKKMELTIDNISKLQRELQFKMIYHILEF